MVRIIDKSSSIDRAASVSVSIVGDIMGSRSVMTSESQIRANFEQLKSFFPQSDINICNLETVISDHELTPSPLSRSNFRTSTMFLNELSKLFNVFLLANNHINDFGNDGIHETLINLKKNNVFFAGIKQINNGFQILEINNIKVCILNYMLLDFPGSDILSPKLFSKQSFIDDMEQCKQICSICLVGLHGGRENVESVDPEFRNIAKFTIDNGASFTFGHHTHVLSGYEVYKEKPIFYSLGNFIFDNHLSELRRNSCVITLLLNKEGEITQLDYKALYIDKHNFPTINQKVEENILAHLIQLSSRLMDNTNDKLFFQESSTNFIGNAKSNLLDTYRKLGVKGMYSYVKRIKPLHIKLLWNSLVRNGAKSDFNIYSTEKINIQRRILRKLFYYFNAFLYQLSPALLTQIRYFLRFGSFINLRQPKTFNEKVQYLKLYNFSDFETKCSDKISVREYVSKTIGAKYLNELLGTYTNTKDIPYDDLPNQFVIKCNHGSGYNIIVLNKDTFDRRKANRLLNKWLKEDYAYRSAECQYHKMQRRILVEKYIVNEGKTLPIDYKIFCFNGVPKFIMVISEREMGYKRQFFDLKWNIMNYTIDFADKQQLHPKPHNLDELVSLAEQLSQGVPFVRVDFFVSNGNVYFGELTFTPVGGMPKYYHRSIQYYLGSIITVPGIEWSEANGK